MLGGVGVTGVMSGGIGGSITMRVDADLNDIKRGTIVRDENGQVTSVSYRGDGRVRLSEIGTMMLYPGVIPFTNISTGIPGGPLNLFDLTFSGSISPYIWIQSVVTGTMAFKLFEIPLAAPTVKPTLGKVSNCVLTLNAGSRAADRLWVNTADGGENFILSGMGSGVVDVEFDSFVVRYTGVTKVVADLGDGNDTLDASRLFDTTISLDVRGGDGNDTVLFGTGGGVAVDLVGNNTLDASRSQRSVTLVGGLGDDKLTGGLAADVLMGGEGTNVLLGGAGCRRAVRTGRCEPPERRCRCRSLCLRRRRRGQPHPGRDRRRSLGSGLLRSCADGFARLDRPAGEPADRVDPAGVRCAAPHR